MKVVFFTGAGISKESGLDTFRDKGGIWDQYDPEAVCSLKGYQKNKKAVLDFHNLVRKKVSEVSPNEAHFAIAQLQNTHDVNVITQNIDDLHERAGSKNVLKVHGDIFTAKLKRYKDPIIKWDKDIEENSYPEGHIRCQGSMRHDVVFFGEEVKHQKKAIQLIKECDVLIVVGTSLEVYPAAGWVNKCLAPMRILIDPKPKVTQEQLDDARNNYLNNDMTALEFEEIVRFNFTHIIAKSASVGIKEAITLMSTE